MSAFGDLLRRYRLEAGISQERLAEQAGVSLRGISDLERGARTSPRFETVQLLADGLALTRVQRETLVHAARSLAGAVAQSRCEQGTDRLPMPPTPLVGREREIASIITMLDDPAPRLVSLTGPGGVGKTRIAIEVGSRVADRFPDGLRMVDLVPLKDASLVSSAIAESLGVKEAPGLLLSTAIVRSIGNRHLLLLLDNFEHVLPAARSVADLLAQCPRLAVLVTSRAPLGIRGERQVHVSPLGLPDPQSTADETDALNADAVRLFVARAMDVRPTFDVRDEDIPVVVEICRRLDGLPLALELAAVHTRSLSLLGILSRLDQRLPLLRSGAADSPARHRTLRATLEWSLDLLNEEEQRLFRRLAVFAGGWTLQAAEAVGGEGADIFESLDVLVAHSMVLYVDGDRDGPRYTMLEIVREFAREQLQMSGELEDINRRHSDWFVHIARSTAANLADVKGQAALTHLVAEQGNIRAALTWLRDNGEMDQGLRLATALGAYWRLRSAPTEGRRWLETFLTPAARRGVADSEWVAGLLWAGELAAIEGDMASAEQRLGEGLEIARKGGDKPGMVAALAAMGSMATQRGDIVAAIPLFEEGMAEARELGAHRQVAFLAAYLAAALMNGDGLDRARALLDESRALLQDLGDVRSFEVGFTAMAAGWLAITQGDLDRAAAEFELCDDLSRGLDAKGLAPAALAGLGEIAMATGNVELAAARFSEGLVEAQQGAFPVGIAFCLQGLVRVAVDRGDLRRAARIVAALDGCGGSIGSMPSSVQARYDEAVACIHQRLDPLTIEAEAKRGRQSGLQEILVHA